MTNEQLLDLTERSELLTFLGVKIESAEKGRVVLSMPVTSKVHQYIGIMNGGVSLLLSETSASIGAVISSDLTRVTPVGIEINANHLRAVSKGIVTAEATSVYHGKTLSVWTVEIKDERGKLVCISRMTLSLQQKPAFPAKDA